MTKRAGDELREALRQRGYQPPERAVRTLFEKLGDGDDRRALDAERALARRGLASAEEAMARFPTARAPLRGRLVRLVGRVGQAHDGAALDPFLRAALSDGDPYTRRQAAIALGKRPGAGVEDALLASWRAESDPVHRRRLAAALGKVGGAAALSTLTTAEIHDPELRRITDEAVVKISRTLGRLAPGKIDPERRPARPTAVLVHCRAGLEGLVSDELGELGARPIGPGRVAATLRGPLAQLFRARSALRFGFPIPTPHARAGDLTAVGAAVASALASDEAWAVARAFTEGPVRYRLEWASGGHRRSLTFRVAEKVARARPEMVNDPTASLWEAVVTEGERVEVELWPRGLGDERFAYRLAQVPASSHPTLAAALARLGGARADDVVWDPFVGSATELVERARLGPYARMWGSDTDAAALARARVNLEAAGVERVTLVPGDARTLRPDRVTLILTNPPMGRRVLDKRQLGALYSEFLRNAAAMLPPGGRLAWISARPEDTASEAEQLGLRAQVRQRVDMGGFDAELQVFSRGSRAAARFGKERRPGRR